MSCSCVSSAFAAEALVGVCLASAAFPLLASPCPSGKPALSRHAKSFLCLLQCGLNSLMLAVIGSHEATVKLLLTFGADVDALTNVSERCREWRPRERRMMYLPKGSALILGWNASFRVLSRYSGGIGGACSAAGVRGCDDTCEIEMACLLRQAFRHAGLWIRWEAA